MTSVFEQRVALVYDWVNTPFGGAERVLLALQKIFPQAPLYTSVYDAKKAVWAKNFDVRTTYLQAIPFAKQAHRELLPLLPQAFEHLDLSEYDVVISVTSAEAKGVIVRPDALHICYLLTPTRYLWSHTHEYQAGFLKPLKAYIFSKLRDWDFKAAQKPNVIIPISKLVQKRCLKYYQRKTEPVIYPPCSLTINPQNLTTTFHDVSDYYLVVSRLVDYKNVDLCIEACVNTEKKLVIVGDGPAASQIRSFIDTKDPKLKYIHWYTQLSDEELQRAYSASRALLLPAEEDFGITALEAQAFGKPVIVYYYSGAAEVVVDQKTGIHVRTQTVDAFSKAILDLEQKKWNSDVIKSHASAYNEQAFTDQFTKAVQKAWHQSH
jgi:glycosyltransferase involved in cell wall biosynthesis